MTVRRRTLAHLTRALAVSGAVTTSCGSNRLPPADGSVGADGQSTASPPTTSPATTNASTESADASGPGAEATTPPPTAQLPTEPPPVVCDPMPAPYCPPDAMSAARLSDLTAYARWADKKVLLSLTFPRYLVYEVDGVPTTTHGTIEPSSDPNAGITYTLTPEAANVPMRVVFRLKCEGQTGKATYDVLAGAPGAEVKVTFVKAGK